MTPAPQPRKLYAGAICLERRVQIGLYYPLWLPLIWPNRRS
jgi:hypothetical protein